MFGSVLLGTLVPAAIAGIVLAIGWAGTGEGRRGRSAAPALGMALAYPVGHAAAVGWPPFPPIEATQWVVYIALVSGTLAALGPTGPTAVSWDVFRRISISAGVPAVLLWPLVKRSWSSLESLGWLGGTGLVLFAVTASLSRLARSPAGRRLPLALLATASAAAGALVLAGSALLGQLAGVLAASLGALVVAGLVWPARSCASAVLPAVAVLAALLVIGQHYVELPAAAALLLGTAPLAVWALALRPLAGWRHGLALLGLTLVPLAAALVIVWNALPEDASYY